MAYFPSIFINGEEQVVVSGLIEDLDVLGRDLALGGSIYGGKVTESQIEGLYHEYAPLHNSLHRPLSASDAMIIR